MKQEISFLALIVVLSDSVPAQDPSSEGRSGSICLAPVSDDGDPRGYVSDDFRVRVDGGKWNDVPSDVPKLIAGLSLKDKQLGIDAILAADFLSDTQEADILCSNAARFLRLAASACVP